MDKYTCIAVVAVAAVIAAVSYFEGKHATAVGVECVKRPDREWVGGKCVRSK